MTGYKPRGYDHHDVRHTSVTYHYPDRSPASEHQHQLPITKAKSIQEKTVEQIGEFLKKSHSVPIKDAHVKDEHDTYEKFFGKFNFFTFNTEFYDHLL